MEEPPIIQTQPVTGSSAGLGRIGLYFSLAALAALVVIRLAKPG
jgi:hypothetical protein